MPLTEFSPLDAMERADNARMAPLVGTRQDNNPDEDKRERVVGEDNEEMFLPVRTLRTQYLDYLDSKVDEIEEQKDSRRYYHGAQLTAEQLRVLRARHQPVQIWNRVGRKINGIVGVVERGAAIRRRKAAIRSPKPGRRSQPNRSARVLDGNQFKFTIEPVVPVAGGDRGHRRHQLVLRKGDKGDPDIGVDVVGDEYFYDPRSYRFDFKDVRYEGIAKWLDLDAAIEMFPDKADELEGLFQGDSDLTTNPDREIKWIISTSRRLRLVEHWYKHKGRWCWAFYVANVLLDQGVSPFVNEKGNSVSSFDMFCAAIDQDGDRYSFVRTFKGPQDALNQGKSKTLALANSRRIIADKGAVDDVEIARREVARHDGYLEVNPGKAVQGRRHPSGHRDVLLVHRRRQGRARRLCQFQHRGDHLARRAFQHFRQGAGAAAPARHGRAWGRSCWRTGMEAQPLPQDLERRAAALDRRALDQGQHQREAGAVHPAQRRRSRRMGPADDGQRGRRARRQHRARRRSRHHVDDAGDLRHAEGLSARHLPAAGPDRDEPEPAALGKGPAAEDDGAAAQAAGSGRRRLSSACIWKASPARTPRQAAETQRTLAAPTRRGDGGREARRHRAPRRPGAVVRRRVRAGFRCSRRTR
jgi:hypothetical protein